MIEIIIGLVVAVVLWNLRGGFYSQSEVWKEKVDIKSADFKADLQEDYNDLVAKIKTIKETNGDKWYDMKDIEELMK